MFTYTWHLNIWEPLVLVTTPWTKFWQQEVKFSQVLYSEPLWDEPDNLWKKGVSTTT